MVSNTDELEQQQAWEVDRAEESEEGDEGEEDDGDYEAGDEGEEEVCMPDKGWFQGWTPTVLV